MGACINNACLPQRALTQETQAGVQIRVKRTGLEREREGEGDSKSKRHIKRKVKPRHHSGLVGFYITTVLYLML